MSGAIDLGAWGAAADPALVVVTTAHPATGEVDGCLVGFHSQASIDPVRYVVWLSTANRTTRLAAEATHLAVHLLAAGDLDLAARFGGITGDNLPGGGHGKLAEEAWTPGPGGVPLLEVAPVRLIGRILERPAVGGDHRPHVLDPVALHGQERLGTWVPFRLADADPIEPGHPAS